MRIKFVSSMGRYVNINVHEFAVTKTCLVCWLKKGQWARLQNLREYAHVLDYETGLYAVSGNDLADVHLKYTKQGWPFPSGFYVAEAIIVVRPNAV